MAFASTWGDEVEPVKPMTVSDAEILRSQDITIIRLRRRNLSWRKIGRYLNLSDQGVRKRYLKIPPEVRERYERLPALG